MLPLYICSCAYNLEAYHLRLGYMASIGWALLLFLAQLQTLLSTSIMHHADAGNLTHLPVPFLCHPDQAKALLQLKKSFNFCGSTTRLLSWLNGTDCCLWEGVGCDTPSGQVTILDLNNRRLFSYSLDPALFSLVYLRRLDLSMNDLGGYIVPDTGFERFTFLTHLNLSNSGLHGQIPIGISKLVNLLSLDLSNWDSDTDYDDDVFSYPTYYVSSKELWQSNFDTLVANLSNLRELYLDSVDFSRSGEEWGKSLATSVPHLQVLSLSQCGLNGPIPKSLSRLDSLATINLQGNFRITPGPFPEFFMDFLSLTVLQLSDVNLKGRFPSGSFKSKNLRVLDFSGNQNLSGNLPNFSNVSSLETLVLDWTSFSYAGPMNSNNFPSLKELSLGGNLSVDFLKSFGRLGSLSHLELKLDAITELGPIFSWIGHHENLISLELSSCNFSEIKHTLLGNFKTLRRLRILFCNLPKIVLHAVGSLTGLQTLEMIGCTTDGSMPSSIGNLTNLRTLYISSCEFSGPMPAAIGKLTDLRNIKIEFGGFSGPVPAAIGNLTKLRNLYISWCGFSDLPAAIGNLTYLKVMYIQALEIFGSSIPYAIGKLSELTRLSLNSCKFSGSIPSSIGNLSRLTLLDLSSNSLTGEIPSSIFSLPILNQLDLSYNQLSGKILGFDDKADSQLETMSLSKNALSGFIPKAFFQLTSLVHINVSSNNSIGFVDLAHFWRLSDLAGEIPSSIFSLPILNHLDLSYNQLSGHIQGFDDKADSQLETVFLSNNALSGFLPKAFFQLTSLIYIDVSSNNLTGSVDLAHFWRLCDLAGLHLSYNKLHVMDVDDSNPMDTTYLAGLFDLGLASCNMTRFPSFLRHVTHISYLDLSWNKISGDVPTWIWESVSLYHVNLSHNMFTSMQLNQDVISPIIELDVSFNRLSGRISMLNSSGVLDYSNNMFSSLQPNWTFYLCHTMYLSVSNNSINGHVPPSICNATALDVLDLSYNNFNGPIPSCLIENVPLSVLSLRENHFKGTLPSNITTQCSLQTIDLHGNNIEGKLPRGLSTCIDLEVLDFGGNRIADTFPSWLMGLPKLSILVLRSNQLHGTIGVEDTKSEECFPSLQVIDLASNNFSGNLRLPWLKRLKSMMAAFNSSGKTLSPLNNTYVELFYQYYIEIMYKGTNMKFGRMLTTVTAIDFSNNRLEGTIPETFGTLVSLRVFNLSHNAFTGNIPVQLGRMTDLELLDLSCNQLSGEIPEELTKLTFLGTLNLSNNQLVGKIPEAGQFSTFDNSSFEGNVGLCGLQLPKSPCGGSPHTPSMAQVNRSSHHVDVVLFLFVGLGFGVGFASAILVKWSRIGKCFIAATRASPS